MDYPWYVEVSDDSLEQGDLFHGYPIFVPDVNMDQIEQLLGGDGQPEVAVDPISANVVVVSQSCDLVNDKIDTVILCNVWRLEEIDSHLGKTAKEIRNRRENIRRGNDPQWHLLNSCESPSFPMSVVEFRRIYTTPKTMLSKFASLQATRIRLCPPYREHLSQAFARYFMRVGLPVDIPAF